jgi:putative peptide zinc metalloprotease protein
MGQHEHAGGERPVPLIPPAGRPAQDPLTGETDRTATAAPSRSSTTVTTRSRRQDPPPASADFTEERMLRTSGGAPQRGWRNALYRASFGWLDVGPGPAERRARELAARVKAPIRGSRRIAVISRKGGVGKTTTALMLGHTFASRRGDRVVALDANPDAGSLGYRVRRETSTTVTDLLADAEVISRYADIRAFTSQAPTRLEVVASDHDPQITRALGEADYHRAVELLDRHYNMILLDTGTGILDSAIQGVLKEADQVVVVIPPALDGARVAAATLDWLDSHGFEELVASAVAVINSVRKNGLVEVERVEQHFAKRCAATVRIPFDPHLEAGAESSLGGLRPVTRDAYLELAAQVADQFTDVNGTAPRRHHR